MSVALLKQRVEQVRKLALSLQADYREAKALEVRLDLNLAMKYAGWVEQELGNASAKEQPLEKVQRKKERAQRLAERRAAT